jgi:aminoglycoside phosphotransferase
MKLWWPDLHVDDPRLSGTVTLRVSRLPPFMAISVLQYHLPPTPSSCQLLHEFSQADACFSPSPHEISRTLEALAAVPDSGRVCFLDNSLVVKRGGPLIIREAMAMIYIRQKTSIPVPTVRLCFQHDKQTYLVMDRVNGQSLGTCLSEMSDQRLKKVVSQLASYIQQLRDLGGNKPMGSWPSGPYDNLLFDPPPLREFYVMQEFQSYWIYRLGTYMGLPEVPSALREIGQEHSVVFTHGDLAPRNIMVDGEEITGILDWETLGWYPDFWEFMGATRSSSFSSNWVNELSLVLGRQTGSSRQYASILFDVFFRPWAE